MTTTRSAASTCPAAASGSTTPWRRSARSGTATASSSRRSALGPSGNGPSLIVGGYVQAAFERAAKYGDGWTQGGSGTQPVRRKTSQSSRRPGRRPAATDSPVQAGAGLLLPRSRRPDERRGTTSATTTPGWVTSGPVNRRLRAPKDADSVRRSSPRSRVDGCDELIFFPAASTPSRSTLLADAAGL